MNVRHLQWLGIPGLLGVGLVLFCASFYFSTLAPMQDRLTASTREAAKLADVARSSQPKGSSDVTGSTETRSATIQPTTDPLEIIRRLNAAAESSSITIDRTSYAITENEGVKRIGVSLPSKGNYLALRAYLREALTVGRDARVDSLLLQRARATDPVLDADLKLSFGLDAK